MSILAGCDGAMVDQPILVSTKSAPSVTLQTYSTPKSSEMLEGHQLISQNERYALYLKQDTLSIIIKDLETGSLMHSTLTETSAEDGNDSWQTFMKSGVVIEYIKGVNVVPYRVDMITGKPEVGITYFDEGFVAKVSYPELQISYEMTVTLTEEGFTAQIPEEKILEASDEYKVGCIFVYPFLGYSKAGLHEGYMFIPDGTGALIYLEDNKGKFKQPYSELVYGENVSLDEAYVLSLFHGMDPEKPAEKILAPVFGMVHTDEKIGYLGVIEEGYTDAWIEAYPNGAVTPYDWITSKFVYRKVYEESTSQSSVGAITVVQENRNHFDIHLNYLFVGGSDADYVGLAKAYRDDLESKQLILEKEDRFKVRLDFLGADQENWMVFERTVPMTTDKQVSSIINDLVDAGITDILGVYKGWQEDGIYGGLPIESFKPEGDLGGKKGLLHLLDEMKTLGVDFYLYQDALRINPETHSMASRSAIKKFNKKIYEEEVYAWVFSDFYYLKPAITAENLKKSLSSYVKNDVEGVMLSGITDTLFSYYSSGETYGRGDTAYVYEASISSYDKALRVMLEKPFSYLWKYTDAIIDMPIYSSNYIFTDEEVPFLAIVLKGKIPMYAQYSNFQANQREYLLKLVEQGVYPSFLITQEDPAELQRTNSSSVYSSQYAFYKETIETYYKELKTLNDLTDGASIEAYTHKEGVSIVSYSNGVKIYINYNKTLETVDGLSLEPESYKVGEVK